MDNETTPLDVARAYVSEHYPHMEDGVFTENVHNPQHDIHLSEHLDEIQPEHFDDQNYSVVTTQKNIDLGNNISIPSILKIKIDNKNEIKSVLGSKSFDSRPL